MHFIRKVNQPLSSNKGTGEGTTGWHWRAGCRKGMEVCFWVLRDHGGTRWLTAKLRTRKGPRICNHLIESELQAGMVVGISTLDVPGWDQTENECIKGSETRLLVVSWMLFDFGYFLNASHSRFSHGAAEYTSCVSRVIRGGTCVQVSRFVLRESLLFLP